MKRRPRGRIAKRREADIQSAILKLLKVRGVRAWKVGSGAFRVNGRYVKMGQTGMADIIGICAGPERGRFLAIECKTASGRLTADQAAFLDWVNIAGGLAFVARSCEDVAKAFGWAP